VWIGRSFIIIGVIHTLAGLIFFGDVFGPILRDGVFRTVGPGTPPDRGIAFWFFMTGFMALIVGLPLDQLERHGIQFPASLPWVLLVIAIVGCIMIPASGFWLLGAPIVGMFLRQRALAVIPASNE
jgi:hypothetical protein